MDLDMYDRTDRNQDQDPTIHSRLYPPQCTPKTPLTSSSQITAHAGIGNFATKKPTTDPTSYGQGAYTFFLRLGVSDFIDDGVVMFAQSVKVAVIGKNERAFAAVFLASDVDDGTIGLNDLDRSPELVGQSSDLQLAAPSRGFGHFLAIILESVLGKRLPSARVAQERHESAMQS